MADSSAVSPAAERTRASAGTRSPASRQMRSPGTSWPASTRQGRPSRMTLAMGAERSRRASSAFWALSSWVREMTALRRTMPRIRRPRPTARAPPPPAAPAPWGPGAGPAAGAAAPAPLWPSIRCAHSAPAVSGPPRRKGPPCRWSSAPPAPLWSPWRTTLSCPSPLFQILYGQVYHRPVRLFPGRRADDWGHIGPSERIEGIGMLAAVPSLRRPERSEGPVFSPSCPAMERLPQSPAATAPSGREPKAPGRKRGLTAWFGAQMGPRAPQIV